MSLMLGEAAHRFDERRDQVVTVLEMNVDVPERSFAALINTINRVAEIDGMQKSATIAERL